MAKKSCLISLKAFFLTSSIYKTQPIKPRERIVAWMILKYILGYWCKIVIFYNPRCHLTPHNLNLPTPYPTFQIIRSRYLALGHHNLLFYPFCLQSSRLECQIIVLLNRIWNIYSKTDLYKSRSTSIGSFQINDACISSSSIPCYRRTNMVLSGIGRPSPYRCIYLLMLDYA